MKRICLVLACLSFPLTIAGCGSTAPQTEKKTDTAAPHDHAGHGAGPHEGVVTDWGGGKYHVEFTVDHDKKEATVYVLGSDEKTPAPVKATKVTLSINEPPFEVELQPQPLEGEREGASSRFVGTHDNLGIVREFAGTITGEIEGTPYTGDFKEEPHGADHKH
jgi:hypothetical protein